MAKIYESILKEFQKELNVNDQKVQKEINTRNRVEMSKEFVEFVKNNNCKIMGNKQKRGSKNDK